MTTPLQSLVASGTKLWLDSIDPKLVTLSKSQGATGATSNPIIVANIVKSGLVDGMIRELRAKGMPAEEVAWAVTNHLVSEAEQVFLPVFQARTRGFAARLPARCSPSPMRPRQTILQVE